MASNVALHIGERYLQAWNQRDWDSLAQLIAPDVIRVTPNGTLRSAETYLQRARWLGSKLDRLQVFGQFHCDNRVCLLYDFHGVAPLGKTPTAEYLLLRDVVGWKANEVAGLLVASVDSIESALHRARAALAQPEPAASMLEGPREVALLERYLTAWHAADWTQLADLLSEDAVFSMPPVPTWFQGPSSIARFLAGPQVAKVVADGCRFVPTRANGGPAFLVLRAGKPLRGPSPDSRARADCRHP